MAIFRLNYLNQVQIAANISSRNRTKAIIQRFPKELKRNGAVVYYGRQQSAASVEDSGKELAARIR